MSMKCLHLIYWDMELQPNRGAGYNLKNYIDFLVEFANHYGLAPVNMVGNCMGECHVFRILPAPSPPKSAALVLINPPLTEATFLAGFFWDHCYEFGKVRPY